MYKEKNCTAGHKYITRCSSTAFNASAFSALCWCWLCIRKSIRSVKNWVMRCRCGCLKRGADCLHMVQLTPLHLKAPSSLALFKSTLVLPFCYRLTQAVLEKRPLNECSCCSTDCDRPHGKWGWEHWLHARYSLHFTFSQTMPWSRYFTGQIS